ncbi:MAG: MBL fold metallo-hydrolase [Bacteroidales bacterium]
MMQVEVMSFNPFQTNTYILYDETNQCVIIDPSCYEKHEQKKLSAFIEEKNLKPQALLLTHCHIDHILGSNYVSRKYKLKPLTHRDSMIFLENSRDYGKSFGFDLDKPVMPERYLEDGDLVEFGNQQLKVIHTPGHAAGSLCYFHKDSGALISGDVLFQNSIGRTDLPTGDHDTLVKSILQKIITLPEEVTVYPGHGPATNIGYEKKTNPFLTGVY